LLHIVLNLHHIIYTLSIYSSNIILFYIWGGNKLIEGLIYVVGGT